MLHFKKNTIFHRNTIQPMKAYEEILIPYSNKP